MSKYTVLVKGTLDFEVSDITADNYDAAVQVVDRKVILAELKKILSSKGRAFNDYNFKVYGVITDES